MKQFIELLPVALFVLVFFVFTDKDIFISTAVLMGAVCLQLGLTWGIYKSIDRQTQIVFWVVIVFGAATLLFQDQTFIQWKPTIVNWAFALALLGAQYLRRINLLEQMLGSQIQLPHTAWRNLSLGWALGFFIAGALNLIVAYGFSLEFWVTYKLVGGFALTLLYIVITIIYLARGGHLKEQLETESGSRVDS